VRPQKSRGAEEGEGALGGEELEGKEDLHTGESHAMDAK
jgi:hypothetical protein